VRYTFPFLGVFFYFYKNSIAYKKMFTFAKCYFNVNVPRILTNTKLISVNKTY